jgi:mannose-1-phosphate guanylyltransferase
MAPFRRAVKQAQQLAAKGFLVTFGVRPTAPATDYGYILRGRRLVPRGNHVRRFVEKPPLAAARSLLRRGALWNSGMFVWRAASFLEEAARCEPSFARWLSGAHAGGVGGSRATRSFASLPSLPVDRAVLERSDRVAVLQAQFRWSDLGSWPALYDLSRKDGSGNAAIGNAIAMNSARNLIYSERGLCVLRGVEDLLVVRTGEVVLVCPRREASEMKQILQELRRRGLRGYL